MTKQLTRERERLQWQKKTDLTRAYGLIRGLLTGINCFGEEINNEGLKGILIEVVDILERQIKN